MFNNRKYKAPVGNTVKSLSDLNWESLSSLGSGKGIPKPEYLDLRDILEGEGTPEEIKIACVKAQAHNSALNANYKKLRGLDNTEKKAANAVLLLPFKAEWVLPHLMAFFGTKQCYPILVDGVVQILDTLKMYAAKADARELVYDNGRPVSANALRGMINFMKFPPRGSIMPKSITQGSPTGRRYSSCVPLLFSAWKTYHGINYSQYNYDSPDLELVLEEELVELFQFVGTPVTWTSEELAQFRQQAMYTKSTGEMKTADRTTTVYTLGNPDFDSLPKLVKLCLLQLWVFQPSMYKDYMLHNLMDLDSPASEIISTEIFVKEEPVVVSAGAKSFKSISKKDEDSPW